MLNKVKHADVKSSAFATGVCEVMHPMRKTYTAVKRFLIRQIPSTDAQQILESYLALPDKSNEPVHIGRKDIYKRSRRSIETRRENAQGSRTDPKDISQYLAKVLQNNSFS